MLIATLTESAITWEKGLGHAYTMLLSVLLGLFPRPCWQNPLLRRNLWFQESVTFKDVSVDCTWEEWMQLDSVQRKL